MQFFSFLPGSKEGSGDAAWQKNYERCFLTCQQTSHSVQTMLMFMLYPTFCHRDLNPSLRVCSIFLSSGRRELATTPVASCIIQDLRKKLSSQVGRERVSSTSAPARSLHVRVRCPPVEHRRLVPDEILMAVSSCRCRVRTLLHRAAQRPCHTARKRHCRDDGSPSAAHQSPGKRGGGSL